VRARALAVGFLVLASLLAALARAQLLSPGPLARAHHQLEGDGKCGSCHQAGRRVVDTLCTDCHAAIGKQRALKDGLHGTKWRNQACGDCHIDHVGRDVSLIRWPGGDIRRFDHQQTGFALDNAHARADCADCHKARTKAGGTSFLDVDARCASCHGDPHQGRLGADCASCHGTKSFAVSDFDHGRTRFPLRGKHDDLLCSSCHGEPRRFEAMRFDDCSACHKSPHEPDLGPCKSCHVEEGFRNPQLGNLGLAQMRRDHPGGPLINGHATVACGDCHEGALDEAPRKGDDCNDCHAPVHEAKFGKRCERCHAQVRWLGLPDSLGYRVHHLTDFPLAGKHASVACEGCHAEAKPPAERYRGVAHARCADCHADPHRGELKEHHEGECGACHVPHGFSPATFGLVQHQSTRFPLDGKHLAAPCAACHGAERPRLSFHAAGSDCQSCHPNPHGERVAQELRQGGCAHCHATAGWSFPRFDHSIWPLEGAHREASCDRCHMPEGHGRGRDPARVDFARFGGAPRECSGCHDDPHAGQFAASAPVRACDHCHDATTFRLYNFPHHALTRFALTGAHENAPCGDCHRVETLHNGTSAVRYRLGYTRCADCHANPHGGRR
jgi:hypothetical protein